MKKLIVVLIILGGLTGLWYWAKSQGSVFARQGKTATGHHGRVEVPVSASGQARERQLIKVKAEASGQITKIHVVEGQMVQPGDLLLNIDEEEEQRNVDQAQAALDQATEQLGLAELNHVQTTEDLDYNIEKAKANLDLAQVRFDNSEHEYEFYKELYENNTANFREFDRARTEFLSRKYELGKTKLDLKRAKTTGPRNIEKAAREIEASKARKRSAEYRLSDAKRRFNKTKVINNYKGACLVVRIHISEGEIAVGAQTTVGSTTLIELADLSAMEVIAKVDETDIASVVDLQLAGITEREAGQPTVRWSDDSELHYSDQVRVEFDALPDMVFEGHIIEVAQKPMMVAQIITYDVRIRLDPGPNVDRVRLGMQGTVEFAPQYEEGLLVPYEAVHKVGGDEYVVRQPNPDLRGEPIERAVEVGLTDGESVVIRSSLTDKDVFYIEMPQRIGRGS